MHFWLKTSFWLRRRLSSISAAQIKSSFGFKNCVGCSARN
jgi:hypothetical protein